MRGGEVRLERTDAKEGARWIQGYLGQRPNLWWHAQVGSGLEMSDPHVVLGPLVYAIGIQDTDSRSQEESSKIGEGTDAETGGSCLRGSLDLVEPFGLVCLAHLTEAEEDAFDAELEVFFKPADFLVGFSLGTAKGN